MKKYIWIVVAILVLSCTSSRKVTKKQMQPEFEIVNTEMIVDKDTIYSNDLRFYEIKSARDGMHLMYQNHGKWNKKISGKHQYNINRLVWENVKLIDGNDATFTVIADGTETPTDYFACLIIFDAEGKDCFKPEHPYREILTDLLVDKNE